MKKYILGVVLLAGSVSLAQAQTTPTTEPEIPVHSGSASAQPSAPARLASEKEAPQATVAPAEKNTTVASAATVPALPSAQEPVQNTQQQAQTAQPVLLPSEATAKPSVQTPQN